MKGLLKEHKISVPAKRGWDCTFSAVSTVVFLVVKVNFVERMAKVGVSIIGVKKGHSTKSWAESC